MKHSDLSGFPRLVEDIDALNEEINEALKRLYLAVGAVVLPCAGMAVYAMSFTR